MEKDFSPRFARASYLRHYLHLPTFASFLPHTFSLPASVSLTT